MYREIGGSLPSVQGVPRDRMVVNRYTGCSEKMVGSSLWSRVVYGRTPGGTVQAKIPILYRSDSAVLYCPDVCNCTVLFAPRTVPAVCRTGPCLDSSSGRSVVRVLYRSGYFHGMFNNKSSCVGRTIFTVCSIIYRPV